MPGKAFLGIKCYLQPAKGVLEAYAIRGLCRLDDRLCFWQMTYPSSLRRLGDWTTAGLPTAIPLPIRPIIENLAAVQHFTT